MIPEFRPTQPELRLWNEFVDALLQASAHDDHLASVQLFSALGHLLGAPAAVAALLYMSDRCAAPLRAAQARGGPEVASFVIEDEDGKELDVEAAPYELRWAGRMVAAAVNGDHGAQFDLIATALNDRQLSACLPVLAGMAACTPEEVPS